MPKTLTVTIVVPDGPTDDEEDVRLAFRGARAALTRLRQQEIDAAIARRRLAGPISGTIMLSDAIRLGSWLPRDHWKAGTLRPLDRKGRDDERAG